MQSHWSFCHDRGFGDGFSALRNATDPALQAIAALRRDRIELFEPMLQRQLEKIDQRSRGGIEIRIAEIAAETIPSHSLG